MSTSGGMGAQAATKTKVGSSAKEQLQQEIRPTHHRFQAALPPQKPRFASGGEALPEWKLHCLCTGFGVPPNLREHLPVGGFF